MQWCKKYGWALLVEMWTVALQNDEKRNCT